MTDTSMTKIDQSKSLNSAYQFGFQEITVFGFMSRYSEHILNSKNDQNH